MHGHYKRILDVVVHYSGQNLKLTSEKVMTLCLDGEKAYSSSVNVSVMPGALDLVDPTTEAYGRFDASGRGGGV
jgi:diacylglycerol kinase family enzyme